jgi:two-component system sensor histidine kinase DesK
VLFLAVAVAAAGAGAERAHVILWALLPGAVLSAMLILRHTRSSWPAWSAAALGAAVYWPLAWLLGDASPREASAALGLTSVVVITVVLLERSQVWTWALLARLEAGRHTAAELAVAKERLRFAGDLHDIQGHYLQALCLKGEITARLIGVDDARARDAAQDVATLARQALADTRAVVHGYRETSLALEMDNAVGILRAAGIDATVNGGPAAIPCAVATPLGRLVREGATNILRHTQATSCTISLSRRDGWIRLSIRNDGVPEPAPPVNSGSGLDGLRQRFAECAGSVGVHQGPGWFELVGTVPIPGQAPTP